MQRSVHVVIGAGGATGSALCKRLLAEGCDVIAAVRYPGRSKRLVELDGLEVRILDAEDWDAVEIFFLGLAREGLRVAGVAHCVGSILLKAAHLTRREEFQETLSKNLSSAFAVTRSAARQMMKSGGGSIVLVSSAVARRGFPNHEAIAAAKAGVMGLALSAAATYAGHGIRVNCVAPGLVDADMSAGIMGNELALEASRAMHPLGREGKADEVASAIAWFLRPEQAWVTGNVLGVDGGLANVYSKWKRGA